MEVGRRGSVEGCAGARFARASVCAGEWETRYVRAGSGPPVLLLADSGDVFAADLLAVLASAHRVVAPEQPISTKGGHAAPHPLKWLGDLMDGLGLLEVAVVVADPRMAAGALAFSLAEPDRVSRLVFLFDAAAAADKADTSHPDRLARAGHPLLVCGVTRQGGVDRDAAEAGTIGREIAEFLLADDAKAGGSSVGAAASSASGDAI